LVQLEKEQVPWANAVATALRAELTLQQGGRPTALAYLELAQERLQRLNMEGYAAATRRRAGVLTDGESGRAMVDEADAWFAARGVRAPERLTAILVGG
jgi:eukaryotic-like serine/threonine-protein kinase